MENVPKLKTVPYAGIARIRFDGLARSRLSASTRHPNGAHVIAIRLGVVKQRDGGERRKGKGTADFWINAVRLARAGESEPF